MGNRYASGKKAFGFCDRCAVRVDIRKMRSLVIGGKNVNLRVCPECYEQDHPQLLLGMRPIDDPQAIRNARPDPSTEVSRVINWGWNPVGGGDSASGNVVNPLEAVGCVGTVTVSG